MINYIKLDKITNLVFYQVPKVLFTGKYKSMSNNARMTYAILRDRLDLSIKNGWHDDLGNVFILYSRENLSNDLGVSDKSVRNYMKELVKLELIQEKRQGLNKPNIIYVCMPQDIENTLNGKKYRSKEVKNTVQESSNLPANDTNINYTDLNDTNNLIGNENTISFNKLLKYNINLSYIEDIDNSIKIINYYCSKYKKIYNRELKYAKETWINMLKNILNNDTGSSNDSIKIFKNAIDKHFNTNYKYKEMYLLHNFVGKVKDNRLYESDILQEV